MKIKKTSILASGTLLCGSLFAVNAETPDIHWTMERLAPASYHSKSPCVEPVYGNITDPNKPLYDVLTHTNPRPVEPAYMPMKGAVKTDPLESDYMPMNLMYDIKPSTPEENIYEDLDNFVGHKTETSLQENIPYSLKRKTLLSPNSFLSSITDALQNFFKRDHKRWSALAPQAKTDNIYTSDPTEPPLYQAPLPPVPLPVKKEKMERRSSLRGLLRRLSGKSSEKPTLIRRASAPELSVHFKAPPSLPPCPRRSLPPLPHSPEALEEFFQGTFVKTSGEDGDEVPIRSLPRNTQEQRQNEKDLILFDDKKETEEPIYLTVLADQESNYQTLPEISLLDDAIDPAILAALPTPLSPSSK